MKRTSLKKDARSSQSDMGDNETPVNTVLEGQLQRPATARLSSTSAARARPAPRVPGRRELREQPEESGAWTARQEGQLSEGGTLGSRGDSVEMGEPPALSEPGTQRDGGARGSSKPGARPGPAALTPCPQPGPVRGAGSGGVGRPANRRILPQAGVHLALVGPGLPVAPVFLVHELVLVILIHVHLPEPGRRHRVLRHPDPDRWPRPPLGAVSTLASPAQLEPADWRLHFPLPLRGVAGSRGSGGSGPARWPSSFLLRLTLFLSLLRRPCSPPRGAYQGGSALDAVRRCGLSARKGRGGAKEAGAGGGGAGGRAESGAAGRGKRRLVLLVRHVITRGFP